MFDIALGVFLFLSPIFFLPKQIGNINALQFYQFGALGNGGFNYLQLQFFYFGVICLFIISLLSKPQREFKSHWTIILFTMCFLSVCFHPIGIRLFGNILFGFLLYYLVIVYTKDYKKIFKIILLVSLLNTIFAILQFFHINLIYRATGRIDGLMCMSTHLGIYQVIALPICYALNPFFAIIPIIGILLSKSVTAIFLMLIWCVMALFKPIKIKNKNLHIASVNIFMFLLSLSIIFVGFNWTAIIQKLSVRWIVWIYTIKEIYHNLFFGVGLKQLQYHSTIDLFENPCSMYLEIIRYLGIFVLVPIFMMVKEIISCKDKILLISCLIILLLGLEKSIMDFPRLAGTIIVLFGFLTITKMEVCH